MTPPMSQLRGLSVGKASLYGLPHLGARYVGKGARRYEHTAFLCAVCGRQVESCHHVVPRSVGSVFNLVTPRGTFPLRSPLFALCGSGTTGCHDGFHGGAWLRARWVWERDEFEAAWWSGELLARFGAHNPALFGYGRWEIENTRTGFVLVKGKEQR